MLPLSVVQGYDLTLSGLNAAALADLRALVSSLEGESPERTRRVLFEAFPEVFNPYAAASSAVSASFYEEVRDISGVGGSFTAQTLDAVETPRWTSLVGFGSAPAVFEQGGSALMYSLLSGGLTQVLTEMAGDTIAGNGSIDRVTVGFQRVPKVGCCAFCGMLASRGAAYSSEGAAGGVVGRGTPIPKVKSRGGQAKGIKPRGSRALGDNFHDHCKCRAVPVFEDNYVEMQSDADKYFDAYADARGKVNDYRKTQGYVGFGDQAASQKMILSEMRKAIGAK
ncbi:hypothetical protein D6T65_05020 [Arthrobacter frigidicola]|nr:hypothetical protein D6T65_05020 [Arthrobacter frigidicola]